MRSLTTLTHPSGEQEDIQFPGLRSAPRILKETPEPKLVNWLRRLWPGECQDHRFPLIAPDPLSTLAIRRSDQNETLPGRLQRARVIVRPLRDFQGLLKG
jgi:hypothetical protein